MVHNEDFYRDIPYENQAEALLQMGCDGIKFMYSPDAIASAPLIAAGKKLAVIVNAGTAFITNLAPARANAQT